MRHVLLLGGTAEARALAARLAEGAPGWRVTASLAGMTRQPQPYGVATRVGGFGGAAGLGAFLRAERVAALIDATHPFAMSISRNAADAAQDCGVPLLRLTRTPWVAGAGDDWRAVASLAEAAALPPPGARVFLALGAGGADAFGARDDLTLLLRVIEPPAHPPAHMRVMIARPPFSTADERRLLRDFRATHLVTKNSGGAMGLSKLRAAAELRLPVIMLERPAPPGGVQVDGVQGALEWLATLA
ncbi:cobalt-precorrin-6A reductase [Brevirhabdus sp.]|uniref:cobalt-precorrin-6A reductase n=1 Tax=Brevirhabdus sp. TaxID=2004514 RepID=UPI004059F286